MTDEAAKAVHQAIGGLLDEGEIAISWVLVVDVAGPDDTRYLAHRGGGGHDGLEKPMCWNALGMLRASVLSAEELVTDRTVDREDPDEPDQ